MLLTIERNNLDLEVVSSEKGSQYSRNFYLWLKSQSSRVWAFRVYREKSTNCLWVGILDGRELIGSKLIAILCNGAKEKTAAWQGIDAVEVEGFWDAYMAIGRCAIDPEHSMYFVDEATRWNVVGESRHCLWCKKASQVLTRHTHEVVTHKWQNSEVAQ